MKNSRYFSVPLHTRINHKSHIARLVSTLQRSARHTWCKYSTVSDFRPSNDQPLNILYPKLREYYIC